MAEDAYSKDLERFEAETITLSSLQHLLPLISGIKGQSKHSRWIDELDLSFDVVKFYNLLNTY